MTKQQLIIEKLAALFTSRNQQPMNGLIKIWCDDLSRYDIDKTIKALENYRLRGDDFPSLPKIIKAIEKKPDSDTAALAAWAELKNSLDDIYKYPLKSNAPAVAAAFAAVCSGGYTQYIESSNYEKERIEREFKKIYKYNYENGYQEESKLPTGAFKSIGIDVKKIGQKND